MEYNTQREQLKITDYGRHVAKMIDYCKTLASREERTAMANAIIDVMAHVNPKVKERTDYRHILWDHLLMMADYQLDVDSPYPVNREESASFHPNRLHYAEGGIRYRHYGRALEDLIRAVSAMPAGDERTLLTTQIAHAMKRQYLQWNRDTVDDSLIAEQLTELSSGRLSLPEGFRFHSSQSLVDAISSAKRDTADAKKKKKKKKK